MDAITMLKDDHKTVETAVQAVREGRRPGLRREAGGRRPDHRGAVGPRRRRGAALLPGHPGHGARRRGRRPREPRGAPHREVGALRARGHGPRGRALRRQGHRAHRERPPPRRRRRRSDYFPEGARRARPQRAGRPRRGHGGRQEDGARPTRTPGRPTRRRATSSSARPPAWSTGSATRSAASPRAACRGHRRPHRHDPRPQEAPPLAEGHHERPTRPRRRSAPRLPTPPTR